MRPIRIQDIVKFRNSSDRSKTSLLSKLKEPLIDKLDKEEGENSGGNYWTSCISAIKKYYKSGDLTDLEEKQVDLLGRIDKAEKLPTKERWKRSFEFIENFKSFDLDHIRPSTEIEYLNKPKDHEIIVVNDIELKAQPDHIFSFDLDGDRHIGGVIFVIKIGGLTMSETGMFTDLLYRYLETHYGREAKIDEVFCSAVDIGSLDYVSKEDLLDGTVPSILESSIDAIKAMPNY